MQKDDDLWNAKEVAEFLKYTPSHTRRAIVTQSGFPNAIQLTRGPKGLRWKASEVRKWVTKKQQEVA